MARFGVKEVADVTLYDINTNEPVLFLDTLKMSSLETSAERSYVTGGKGNPRIMAFDYGKTSQFSIQDALMNPKMLALQNGAELKQGVEIVHKREQLTVVGGAVTLSETPVGAVSIYPTQDGYDMGEKETVTLSGNDATLDAGTTLADGDQVLAYYQFETVDSAETFVIASDKYSKFYKLVGDTVVRNATSNIDEAFQIIVPKIKITSEFSLELSPDGEPATFDMNVDVFKANGSNDMVKMVRY